MEMPDPKLEKPFRQWQIVSLIVLVLAALGLSQAVTTRVNNFPETKIATSSSNRLTLDLNGEPFSILLALTSEEQMRGLSGRASLGENEGMLFVYPEPEQPHFWMKDMNFPLDIIWLDQNKKIVEITQNLSPQTYPETFSPRVPIKYVLEVNANTARKNNLKIGDLIHFSLPETL